MPFLGHGTLLAYPSHTKPPRLQLLHSGFASSHFFLRLRHVPHPVLVLFANCLFLFLTSTWTPLRAVEFDDSNVAGSIIGGWAVAIGGMLACAGSIGRDAI